MIIEGRSLHADAFQVEFGGRAASCLPRSATSLACITPPARAGPHLVTLRLSEAKAYLPSLFFNYVANARFERAYPTAGPVAGGTYVVVSGVNFVVGGKLSCRFGASVVAAVWVSTRRLSCLLPPLESGAVPLQVSNDGTFANAAGVIDGDNAFEVYERVVVLAVQPQDGNVVGGTLVSMAGEHFSPRSAQLGYLRCRFNQSAVPATFLNSSLLRCISPPHAPTVDGPAAQMGGHVPLEVSNNAQDYSQSALTFEYRPEAEVHALMPSMGDVGGGTLVVVDGRGYVSGGNRSTEYKGGTTTILS